MSENNQKTVFLQEEGNEYYERNKQVLVEKKKDLLVELLLERKLLPKIVLEIGCSIGWRLDSIHKLFKSDCYGIDPSSQAIKDGRDLYKDIILEQGTADVIPFFDKKFDLIIFGFCLYLCDRKDLFKIVFEADKFLNEGGHIAIFDFEPAAPLKNKYQHKEGIFSYKMNYSNLFLANPSYFLVSKNIFTHYGFEKIDDPNERVSVSLLRKNTMQAYAVNY